MAHPTAVSAIQTTYRGIKFRSRVEARFAVFLQEVGATWHYEPEAYFLPESELNYLPDFWVENFPCKYHRSRKTHTAKFWLEVKGAVPERYSEECQKLSELCVITQEYGYFATYDAFSFIVDTIYDDLQPHFMCTNPFADTCSALNMSNVRHPNRYLVAGPTEGFDGVFSTPESDPDMDFVNRLCFEEPFWGEFDTRIWAEAAKAARACRFGT